MPSLLSINTVDFTDVFRTTPSENSVLFSADIKRLITSTNFGTLLAPNSIPTAKIQPIEGYNIAQYTLSGYNGPTAPGQIGLRTIKSENIAFNAVKGPEGGTPSGTVIFFAGPDPETAVLPDGYMLCDGAYVAVAAYPELFNAIGYKYGNNGSAQFRLPIIDIFQGLIPLIKI